MDFPVRAPVRLLLLGSLILCGLASGSPAGAEPSPPEKVVIQLKWKHQFQFAGYYAAKHRGYYAAEGLDVELREKPQGMIVSAEVLSGRAQYGVLTSELLVLRARGEPVVVLAAILQHSPNALLVRRGDGVRSPRDLIGRKVMLIPDTTSAEIYAMFRRLGVKNDEWESIAHSYRHQDLLEGKVSAISVYVSDRPFFEPGRDQEVKLLRPITHGIDFYGDCLFTTQAELEEHPDRARALRRASLKGWEYAFEHPNEIIDLIENKYQSTRSRAQLVAEAEVITELAQPVFIQVGQMNPDRWRQIGETYLDLGMIDALPPLGELLYDPAPPVSYAWAWWLGGLLLLLAAGAAAFGAWNVTLRRKIREQTASLREREARYRAIVEDQTELICRQLLDGTLTFVNQAYCRFVGKERDELLGASVFPFVNSEDLESVKSDLARLSREAPVSTSLYRASGGDSPRWTQWTFRLIVDEAGQALEIQCCGQDVTQRTEAEAAEARLTEQLRQSQKMEAVGQLAGGVAHDFNNLLTVILGNAEFLARFAERNDGSSPPNWLEEVSAIQGAGRQASDLTKSLLAFGRKSVVELTLLSLPTLVEGIHRILERLLREDIRFSISVDAEVPLVRADRTQLEQVLLNLVINGQDAMPDGGSLTVRVAGCELSEAEVDRNSPAGDYVLLTVSDTGEGIAEDVREHIFEPFFTTKGVGHGTGLGLATVYGVVTGLKGFVRVESELGQGSTFSVYLPASEGALAADSARVLPLTRGDVGGERRVVLVCEDETEVRRLVSRTLTQVGYEVLLAADGEQALEVARQHPGAIDLLICDVVMPGKSGPLVAAGLRTDRPHLPVLFMSGYAQEGLDRHGLEEIELLRKPFGLDELVARVGELLALTPQAAQPPG
ncbi:MAG: ABC transporter substrate-binding protein [Planctomycetes bacterium]|nr:ABC transporter substrate-binding protein [Planctomycetota bacterium]